MKELMVFKGRSFTLPGLSRLLFVPVCLCAFSVSPLPQLSGWALGESSGAASPVEEDGENAEEELVVTASARRRVSGRSRIDLRPRKMGLPRHSFLSVAVRPRAIVGHQLVNGLRAPLVI